MTTKPTSTAKNCHGGGVKPRVAASGEIVSATPIATTVRLVTVSKTLGRLRKHGTLRVRMAKMISVWVASDSTNQPVRNSMASACSTPNINPKVKKSNSELMGPKISMNRRMKVTFQCDGAWSCSSSTRSVGIASCELS
jgi:hypothetical protein